MCELLSSKGSPGVDKIGPNRTAEHEKQIIRYFIGCHQIRQHYTRRDNPNRPYLSPKLNVKKLLQYIFNQQVFGLPEKCHH